MQSTKAICLDHDTLQMGKKWQCPMVSSLLVSLHSHLGRWKCEKSSDTTSSLALIRSNSACPANRLQKREMRRIAISPMKRPQLVLMRHIGLDDAFVLMPEHETVSNNA